MWHYIILLPYNNFGFLSFDKGQRNLQGISVNVCTPYIGKKSSPLATFLLQIVLGLCSFKFMWVASESIIHTGTRQSGVKP